MPGDCFGHEGAFYRAVASDNRVTLASPLGGGGFVLFERHTGESVMFDRDSTANLANLSSLASHYLDFLPQCDQS